MSQLKTYFLFIIAENVTVLDFVGVWTYNLTVNVGHSRGGQKDIDIRIECSNSSENGFQCIGAGDPGLGSSYYTILSNGSIQYDEDPSYQATLLQNGILVWYQYGTMIDSWEKQGIIISQCCLCVYVAFFAIIKKSYQSSDKTML